MKGVVIAVDPRQVFAAIKTGGGITPVEIMGGNYDFELWESVSGNLEDIGTHTTLSKENGGSVTVLIADCHCDREQIRKVYKI